jgi:hypothetical protein
MSCWNDWDAEKSLDMMPINEPVLVEEADGGFVVMYVTIGFNGLRSGYGGGRFAYDLSIVAWSTLLDAVAEMQKKKIARSTSNRMRRLLGESTDMSEALAGYLNAKDAGVGLWENAVADQGWNSDSQLCVIKDFIASVGLTRELVVYAKLRADEENESAEGLE